MYYNYLHNLFFSCSNFYSFSAHNCCSSYSSYCHVSFKLLLSFSNSTHTVVKKKTLHSCIYILCSSVVDCAMGINIEVRGILV